MSDSRNAQAVIVVDPQPDFFEGGALPIAGATGTAKDIAAFLRARGGDYSLKIVTQDWHLDPGDHWSDHPDFITTWPVHCEAGSRGAQIHSSLADETWDAVIRKGLHEGAYSGFEGRSADGASLSEVLQSGGVNDVTVVGFATDHCVRATALDARSLGLKVTVALELCAGVDAVTTSNAVTEMRDAGVTIVTTGYL